MRHLHAFWLAGGTRGVDDVGNRLRINALPFNRRTRDGGLHKLILQRIQRQHRAATQVETLRMRALGDQCRQACIADHVGQAFLREGGIKRHIPRTGLQDAQQRSQHVHAAIQGQPDQRPLTYTAVAQQRSDAIGTPFKFRVGQCLPLVAQGNSSRCSITLCFEQLVHAQHVIGSGRRLQCHQRLHGLASNHGQAACRLIGALHRVAQQQLVALHPTPDRRRIKQIGVVLAFQLQAAFQLHGIHEQLEILESPRIGGELGGQAGEPMRIPIDRLVDGEHDAHQRQPAGVTIHTQLLEQGAEGVTLMVDGIQQCFLRGAYQGRERL